METERPKRWAQQRWWGADSDRQIDRPIPPKILHVPPSPPRLALPIVLSASIVVGGVLQELRPISTNKG